jgi:hypothetical protein
MRYCLTFIILFFLMACTEEGPDLPIPEDKLVKVLVDVHLAEAALQGLGGLVRDSTANVYYDQIAQRHDIERADLDSTIISIRKDPKAITKIYTKVLEELTAYETGAKK